MNVLKGFYRLNYAKLSTKCQNNKARLKMKKPELLDVIELLTDIPELSLRKGEQGAIIEDYQDGVYEVEFTT